MIPNNNLSVLPWYGSLSEQNARKWWVYDRVYPLFTPAGFLPPFQIMREHRANNAITQFSIYTRDGVLVGNYTSAMDDAVTIKHFDALGYDVIVFPGTAQIVPSLGNGQYYALISDGAQTWYSEVFTAVNDISPYLKITWWDEDDFTMDAGTIVYKSPAFKNVLYLDSTIAKPDYPFEEEGETRDGYFFPIKQISEKRYRFSFLASEYLLDVMRFIRMADHASINYHGKTYTLDSFLITPEWEAEGDVAAVQAEFDTATVAKKISIGATPTPEAPYVTLSAATWYPGAAASSMLLAVLSNANWSASGVPAWMTISQASGSGDSLIQLTASANGTGATRIATITFAAAGATPATIRIEQEAEVAPYLRIEPSSWTAPQAGGIEAIELYANVAWQLSGVPAWLTASNMSGSGRATIGLSAAANDTGSTRTATLTFTGEGVQAVTLSVTQLAEDAPYISLSPSTLSFSEAGEQKVLNVSANIAWNLSGLPAWLTADVSSGSGNGTITLTAAANHSTAGQGAASARTATLTVAGTGASASIAANQPAPVVNSLTPSSATIGAAGGTISLAIDAIGAWTLTPSSGVTLSQSTGTGSGSVVVTVAANPGASQLSRSVAISLDDNPDAVCPTLAITQAAESQNYLEVYATGDVVTLEWEDLNGQPVQGMILQKKMDDFSGWEDWAAGTSIIIPIGGNRVKLRGVYPAGTTPMIHFLTSGSGSLHFSGSVMALYDYETMPSSFAVGHKMEGMFSGCTRLVTAPSLPATGLQIRAYYGMFSGCTNLVNAPSTLPATILTNFCYYEMFRGCSSLQVAPQIDATTAAVASCQYMFRGCGLLSAPSLDATTLAASCYYGMFYGCIDLQAAPDLEVASVPAAAYAYMFYGCMNLSAIRCLATSLASNSCESWVDGVYASGIFTKAAAMTGWTTGVDGIPSGWAVIDD